MTPDLRNIALRGLLLAAMLAPGHAFADDTAAPPANTPAPADPTQPPADGEGAPLTPAQMGQAYQKLSPEARTALQDLLKNKGVDGLTSMSESDARSTFNGLPANVKEQIQAKWDAMSDEQRIALKKMSPDSIKQMIMSQMSGKMAETTAKVAETTAEVAEKTKDVMKKSRALVQRWLAAFRAAKPDAQANDQ
jgi:hypothetical protein